MKTKFILIIILIIIGIVFFAMELFQNNWNLKSCENECVHRGYETGDCKWPMEAESLDVNIGSCIIPQSKHCGNKDQCNCYCYNEIIACTADAKICPDGTGVGRVPPDCEFKPCPVSKVCEIDSDCMIFGETGDCNCGCYNKDALPTSTGGACFCAAPTSCECVEGECVGVF